ncbi:hypothetical protein BH24ACT15_BH24ACT15_38400 [soil metagenome]
MFAAAAIAQPVIGEAYFSLRQMSPNQVNSAVYGTRVFATFGLGAVFSIRGRHPHLGANAPGARRPATRSYLRVAPARRSSARAYASHHGEGPVWKA